MFGIQKAFRSSQQTRCVQGERGFSCVRTKWIVPGLLALFPVRHLEKGSQEKCTKAWESRHSKDHQCLHWLSCAVKVLIKNVKVGYFCSSQKKD